MENVNKDDICFFWKKCLSKNGWNNGVDLSNGILDKPENGLFRLCLALSNGILDKGVALSNGILDKGVVLSNGILD